MLKKQIFRNILFCNITIETNKYTKNGLIHMLYFPFPWVLGKLIILNSIPGKECWHNFPGLLLSDSVRQDTLKGITCFLSY